ncbi:MAG: hypothetical protein PWP08_701 [Methanofollis sp.]|nr:hypothetical protein [Methanofollis sp.]
MPDERTSHHALPPDIPLGGLISMIHRMHGISMNTRAILPGQFPFILTLSKRPGITQDDLAAHFSIDKGTVARAVRRMEENGLLTRTPDPENRRRFRLFLTEEGEALVPKILAADREWEDALLSGLSGEERGEVLATIRMLAERSHDIARSREEGDDAGI